MKKTGILGWLGVTKNGYVDCSVKVYIRNRKPSKRETPNGIHFVRVRIIEVPETSV